LGWGYPIHNIYSLKFERPNASQDKASSFFFKKKEELKYA